MVDIIFDILYINQTPLTRYPLSERREALRRIINPVERRFEVHSFKEANTTQDIETELRKVVEEACVLFYEVAKVTGQKD
jgi:DNA ligase-4